MCFRRKSRRNFNGVCVQLKKFCCPTNGYLIASLCSAQTFKNCAQEIFVLSTATLEIDLTKSSYTIDLPLEKDIIRNRQSNFLLLLSFVVTSTSEENSDTPSLREVKFLSDLLGRIPNLIDSYHCLLEMGTSSNSSHQSSSESSLHQKSELNTIASNNSKSDTTPFPRIGLQPLLHQSKKIVLKKFKESALNSLNFKKFCLENEMFSYNQNYIPNLENSVIYYDFDSNMKYEDRILYKLQHPESMDNPSSDVCTSYITVVWESNSYKNMKSMVENQRIGLDPSPSLSNPSVLESQSTISDTNIDNNHHYHSILNSDVIPMDSNDDVNNNDNNNIINDRNVVDPSLDPKLYYLFCLSTLSSPPAAAATNNQQQVKIPFYKAEVRHTISCPWCDSDYKQPIKLKYTFKQSNSNNNQKKRKLINKNNQKTSLSNKSIYSISILLNHLESNHSEFKYEPVEDPTHNIFIFIQRNHKAQYQVEDTILTFLSVPSSYNIQNKKSASRSISPYKASYYHFGPAYYSKNKIDYILTYWCRPIPVLTPLKASHSNINNINNNNNEKNPSDNNNDNNNNEGMATDAILTTTQQTKSNDIHNIIKYNNNSNNNRKYYQAHIGRPMTTYEHTISLVGDSNYSRELLLARASIDEYEDVSIEEKQFMKLWNAHMSSFTLYGDSFLPLSCLRFANRFGNIIYKEGFRYIFLLHLVTLWEFGLLSHQDISECMSVIDKFSE